MSRAAQTTMSADAPATPHDQALAELCASIEPVETERIAWVEARQRVLAEPVTLDRPSPACDVSAMDGYAVRLADLNRSALPVRSEVSAGSRAMEMPHGAAVRIFTGAMVPAGADAVIQREHVVESPSEIQFPQALEVKPGQHIRRAGENAAAGAVMAAAGRCITAPVHAAMASCGWAEVAVHRRVRLGILTTGNEVLSIHDAPNPWELRDGNGPALRALFDRAGWLDPLEPKHAPDRPEAIAAAIRSLLDSCDALFLTGGVSAGDHDYVPGVLRELGIRIGFHRLPIRPGGPLLGAVDGAGRPIFGLPGNPVSAMVTARRFAAAALRRRAGFTEALPTPPRVTIVSEARAPSSLTWFPLVTIGVDGHARLVPTRGSGDWVAAAASAGFVEVPPGEPVAGPRPAFAWSLTDW